MAKQTARRVAKRAEKRRSSRMRLDLLHSRLWHKAQLRAGKTQKESARIAGCTQNAIAYWRMILGLTDPRERARRVSVKAKRTYANKRWFVLMLRQYGTSARLAIGENIALATLGLWRRRHGLSGPRGKRPPLPTLARARLNNRRWMEQRVLQGKSNRQIAAEINQKLKRRGLFLRSCAQKDVEEARKRWRLPTVAGVRALKRMELRQAFGQWLRKHKKILARLPRKQRAMLTRWYMGRRLPASGKAVARKLYCSCANVHALRLEGVRRLHAMNNIPRRFWPIAFGLHGPLVPFKSPRWT